MGDAETPTPVWVLNPKVAPVNRLPTLPLQEAASVTISDKNLVHLMSIVCKEMSENHPGGGESHRRKTRNPKHGPHSTEARKNMTGEGK